MPRASRIITREYRALAELRYVVRRFLSFSAEAARAASVEPQQHQLLLAIKGLPPDMRPTIGIAAERLQLQHNSAVELVKRSIGHGLLERCANKDDHREVLLHITPSGERLLRRLSLAHRKELRSVGPILLQALEEIVGRPKLKKKGRR
jgi:DNA-binding MarR family transcriptional regulator